MFSILRQTEGELFFIILSYSLKSVTRNMIFIVHFLPFLDLLEERKKDREGQLKVLIRQRLYFCKCSLIPCGAVRGFGIFFRNNALVTNSFTLKFGWEGLDIGIGLCWYSRPLMNCLREVKANTWMTGHD